MVPRAALLKRLRAGRTPLVLIVAPPGYGKSTLLDQWAAREPRSFLRVPLQASDRRTLKSVVDAVSDRLQDAGFLVPADLHPTGGGTHDLAAAVWLLGRYLGRFVLALDDTHHVDPDVLSRAVTVVLEALPNGSALAVASRIRPRVAVGGLRARRDLIELGPADLALSEAEAVALVAKAGLESKPGMIRELLRRTHGWPTGLYLGALSLREQPDPADALTQWGGDDRRVAEFLDDEVLSGLPPDLLEYSIQTSVLDELSGPVCDAVLGRTGSGALLDQLAEINPFLQPLDPPHERFAWHPMFRQALEAQLARSAPALRLELHRRASDWFDRRGDVERAIAHSFAAHDAPRAGELLWPNILRYLGLGRNALVCSWLAEFTEPELAARPALALSAACNWLLTGHIDQARHWLTVTTAALERSDDGAVSASLRTGLVAIQAALSRHPEEMCRLAGQACRREPKDSLWRPVCLLLQGVALHLVGDRERARESLERARELAIVGAPVIAALALAQSAMLALEESESDLAGDLADRATALIERNRLSDCPLSALVFSAAAATRAHERRSDEAKRDLRTGIELLTKLGDFAPWYGAETRILLAHASLWLADVVGARALLADASRLARRSADGMVFQWWFEQAWAHMDTLAETRMSGPSSLTIAELRVLRFLPSHRSFREIASQLEVSANTVKTQAHAVYRKLGVASRSEAVAEAHAAGLLGD